MRKESLDWFVCFWIAVALFVLIGILTVFIHDLQEFGP